MSTCYKCRVFVRKNKAKPIKIDAEKISIALTDRDRMTLKYIKKYKDNPEREMTSNYQKKLTFTKEFELNLLSTTKCMPTLIMA